MTDEEWIDSVKRIKDPVEMLECIVENERFFGSDPYYSDLRAAMLNSATRIVERSKVISFDRGFMEWFVDYLGKATLSDLQLEPVDFGKRKEFLKEKYRIYLLKDQKLRGEWE